MSAGNLNNATAIAFGAIVNVSNKVRLGNTNVTMIEGEVAFTASSDKTKKENFLLKISSSVSTLATLSKPKLLEIPSQRVYQAPLVAIELA